MTKININRIVMLGIIVAMIALTALLLTRQTFGSAPSGLYSTFATSSILQVGPSRLSSATSTKELFQPWANCAARVITTYDYPITLVFSKTYIPATAVNPTAITGHIQSASTTIVYDSGIYGCGYVNAYGFTATTSITVSQFY